MKATKKRGVHYGDNWATPETFKQWLIDNGHLNAKHFDPCPLNHDEDKWSGLEIDWMKHNFCNPPYSNAATKKLWVDKVIFEALKGNTTTLLIPCSHSTTLWHDIIHPYLLTREYGKDWFFVEKRIPFIGINSKGQHVNLPEEDKPTNWKSEGEYFWKNNEKDESMIWRPKYIKASGMHDSMIIKFY